MNNNAPIGVKDINDVEIKILEYLKKQDGQANYELEQKSIKWDLLLIALENLVERKLIRKVSDNSQLSNLWILSPKIIDRYFLVK